MSGSTARRDRGELRGPGAETDPRCAKLPAEPKAVRASSAGCPPGLAATPPVAAPKPISASAPPVQTAALQVADPKGKDEDSLLAALWRNSSSWLCSAVLHGVLLLVLVLSWVTISAEPEERFLVTRIEGLAREELEVSTLEDQLADVELQQANALPIGIEDPGVAALGEVDGGSLDPAVDAGRLSAMTSSAELGALFGQDGKGWTTVGKGMGGAEFYGIKATGRRFVFVVDGSNSMGRQNKWPECQRELLAAVSKLRPTQYFYVYLFCGRTYRMFGERDRAKEMVRASAKNVERLQRWLYDYQLQGGTVPHGAMKEALEKLRPDAVYLLSDGQFTDKGGSEKYMLNFARTKNNVENGETGRRYRVAVHTIAFASRRGEVVLKRISDAFQSTFKYVPGAPGRK